MSTHFLVSKIAIIQISTEENKVNPDDVQEEEAKDTTYPVVEDFKNDDPQLEGKLHLHGKYEITKCVWSI